jgi:hypothetical protein
MEVLHEGTAPRLIDGVRYLLHRVEVNGVIAAPLSDGHGMIERPENVRVSLHTGQTVACK